MSEQWLYRYEAKGIQSWILQTGKLREMKGGSLLVDGLAAKLEDAVERQDAGGDIELAAAGHGIVRFPSEEAARDFAAWWPVVVEQLAPGLQIAQAVVQDSDDWFRGLRDSLRDDRNRLQADLPEVGPIVQRAPSTGLPSLPGRDYGGREGRRLKDDGSAARWDAGPPDASETYNGAFPDDVKWLPNLDDWASSYVGVVHADGNDLGNRLGTIRKTTDLGAFSRALTEVTRGAVNKAFGCVLGTDGGLNRDEFPGRPIVVGGDDVTIILRGDLAIDFAWRFIEEFERLSDEKRDLLNGPVTACAGVALVHTGYPFYRAYELAEGLCDWTKTRLRNQGRKKTTPSGLSFYRLTSSMSGEWEELLKEELTRGPDDDGVRLTSCPYVVSKLDGRPTVSDLRGLVSFLKRGDLPRGPLRELVGVMTEDKERTDARYERLQQVVREREGPGKAAWEDFVTHLSRLGCGQGLWREVDGGALESPLLDALTWRAAIDKSARKGDQR